MTFFLIVHQPTFSHLLLFYLFAGSLIEGIQLEEGELFTFADKDDPLEEFELWSQPCRWVAYMVCLYTSVLVILSWAIFNILCMRLTVFVPAKVFPDLRFIICQNHFISKIDKKNIISEIFFILRLLSQVR